MNIFYVDRDPIVAAQNLVDRHVVKMILESAQLLSTAHRIIDGVEYEGQSASGRKVKRWKLPDSRETSLYSATHVNHPSSVWCRDKSENYVWLFRHFKGLLSEYEFRYNKIHKCAEMCAALNSIPKNISRGELTPVTPAMDVKYIVSEDSLDNYRNYYRHGKTHLHKYTRRLPPVWLNVA